MSKKRLFRSRADRKILGVCGGVAEYFDVDPTVIRVVTVILVLFFGLSLWAYIIAALIMPNEPG